MTLVGCVTGPAFYDSARLTAETWVAQGYSSRVGSLRALYGTWGYRWLVSLPRRANFLDSTLLLSCPVKLGWRLLIWTADSTVVQHEAIKGIIIVIVFVIKCSVKRKVQQPGRGRRPTALEAHKMTLSFILNSNFLFLIYLSAVAIEEIVIWMFVNSPKQISLLVSINEASPSCHPRPRVCCFFSRLIRFKAER